MTTGDWHGRSRNPDLTAMSGSVDTSDEGGGGDIRNYAPIFAVAHAHDLARAARALDEDDEDVPGSEVVLHEPEPDREEQRRSVIDASEEAASALEPFPTDEHGMLKINSRADNEKQWYEDVHRHHEGHVSPAPEDVAPAGPQTATEERSEPAVESRDWGTPETATEPQETPLRPEERVRATTAKAPNTASSKSDWVSYAVTQGADRREAEAMTRADLIDRYNPRKAH